MYYAKNTLCSDNSVLNKSTIALLHLKFKISHLFNNYSSFLYDYKNKIHENILVFTII